MPVEPRGLSQEQRTKKEKPEIGMSLKTPESVWNLQKSLAAKAKGSPTFRFYSLYYKICRRDVLAYACEWRNTNHAALGIWKSLLQCGFHV